MATPVPDTKKLLPKEDKEKIEFFYESRFYEMGKRIASLDSLKTDVFELQRDAKHLLDEFQKVSDDIAAQKEVYRKESGELKKSVDFVDGKFAGVFQKIESDGTVYKQKLADLEDFKRNHYSLEKRVMELEKKLSNHVAIQEEFNSQYKQLAERQDRFDKSSLRFVDDISKIRSDIVSHHDRINSLKEMAQSIQGRLDEYFVMSDKLSREMFSRNESVRQTLAQKISDMSKQFEEKIASIVVPNVSSFCTKEELNKATGDIRVFSLDAKNAFANSVNLESQVNYLSKKIDSIMIQMKSYELDRIK